jgi:hypothetical protein
MDNWSIRLVRRYPTLMKTGNSFALSHLPSSLICVDFPEPSIPSTTTSLPFTFNFSVLPCELVTKLLVCCDDDDGDDGDDGDGDDGDGLHFK